MTERKHLRDGLQAILNLLTLKQVTPENALERIWEIEEICKAVKDADRAERTAEKDAEIARLRQELGK